MQVKTVGHSQAFLLLAFLAASAKLILFLQTLYVYCVYAAMSKGKKNKTAKNCKILLKTQTGLEIKERWS